MPVYKKTGAIQSNTMVKQQKAADFECHHSGDISCVRPSCKQVEDFLQQAEGLCQKRNQRFTDLRKQVLSLVCQSEQPVGAYALLDMMKDAGRSAAPPTVYRALDFLQEQGFVHRLASNNTYLACAHPQHQHEAVFLVCHRCGYTRELHTSGIYNAVAAMAEKVGFSVEHASVEVTGLCASCQPAELQSDESRSNESQPQEKN
jgi:Fur family zinc uptake transcriptional regulator